MHQAQKSLERLRNFRYRLTMEKFSAGESAELQARAQAARIAFEDALDDNLNTAEALAAVFNLVTDGNTAMDRGEFRDGDRAAFLDVLERWDRIFAALEDNDHARLLEFGLAKPRPAAVGARDDGEHGDGHQHAVLVESLSDQEIEERIAKAPVGFRVVVQLAEGGDTLDDATVRWPENRAQLALGDVSLTEVALNNAREQQQIIFDPIPRVDGIEASADPLFEPRANVYLMSGRRRRAAG